jgi:hypothetical protein
VLAMAVSPSATLLATAKAPVAQAAFTPKTVAQCKEWYRPHSKGRAACIKRVNSEKPGTSCMHPLISSQTSYGPGGDKADFTVELGGYNPNLLPGELQHVWAIVTLQSNRVVICPKVTILDEPHGPSSRQRYYVSVGPQGGVSSSVTVPYGDIGPIAYARLK